MLITGLKPLFVRYSTFSLNVFTIGLSLASVIGVANITFVVQSYRINTVVMLFIDHREELPVRSTYMVPSFLSTLPK